MSSGADESLRAFLRHEHGQAPVPRSGEPWQAPARLRRMDTPASRRREHLLWSLEAAGLSEDQARAEADRILAGDVWSG